MYRNRKYSFEGYKVCGFVKYENLWMSYFHRSRVSVPKIFCCVRLLWRAAKPPEEIKSTYFSPATKATENLPWQTPLFFSTYLATLHSDWLHNSVKVTAPIGWFSSGVSSRNVTSDTFLEHCMMPLVHAHCMQEPTAHEAPSKYWLPSSSWHVTS